MALIVPDPNGPSPDTTTAQFAPHITGLMAGEDLLACAPCYIKTSDNLVYMSNGTAANEAAEVVGFSARATRAGEPVTLYGIGTRFHYAAGTLSPGAILYVAATAGRLADSGTTGDPMGVAFAINPYDIIIFRAGPAGYNNSVADGAISSAKIADGAISSAKIADGAISSAKIADGAIELVDIKPAVLDSTVVKNMAAGDVKAGIPVLYHISVAAGTNGNTDLIATYKTKIVDVWVRPTTTVADATLQVKNGTTNVITDAMAANTAGAVTRCASIAAAYDVVNAGGTIRVTGSGGATQPAADVYILGYRIA